MTIDYRALCDELKDAYAWCLEECMRVPAEEDTLIQRARAALAQPDPEGPTPRRPLRRPVPRPGPPGLRGPACRAGRRGEADLPVGQRLRPHRRPVLELPPPEAVRRAGVARTFCESTRIMMVARIASITSTADATTNEPAGTGAPARNAAPRRVR